MEGFATLLTTSESIKSGKNRIAALTTNKKSIKKNQPKCDRCGRMGHSKETCKTIVYAYCHSTGHKDTSCWINPNSSTYRPGYIPHTKVPTINAIEPQPPSAPALPNGVIAAIGQATFSLTVNNSKKTVSAFITRHSAISDLIVGCRTLLSWGVFTLASIQQSQPSFTDGLPFANKLFLQRHPHPISRKFPDLDKNDPQYPQKFQQACDNMLKILSDDYSIAFSENIQPNQFVDVPCDM